MKYSSDEIIERFSHMTHSPRGSYSSGDNTYRELLSRLPDNDRPVVDQEIQIGRKRNWSTAASIAIVAGIGIAIAIAGVYTFRNELYHIIEPEATETSIPEISVQTLVFDESPLSDIIAALSQAYGVEIIVASPELENYCLTATFTTDETIGDVLDALCEVGGFLYEIQDNVYVIQK